MTNIKDFKMMKNIILFLILVVIVSCEEYSLNNNSDSYFNDVKQNSKTSLQVYDYINWIENTENGLNISKDINGYIFRLQYKPYSYIALLEKGQEINDNDLCTYGKNLSGLQYYTFSIRVKDIDVSPIEYLQYPEDALVKYFSFDMERDLYLVEGKDTFSCVLFNFERTYGVNPWHNFVLGFETNEEDSISFKNNKTFIFKDKIFDVGLLKMSIKKEELNNIPDLIL